MITQEESLKFTSSYRKDKEEFNKTLLKWIYVIFTTVPFLVVSGLLRAISLHVPQGLTMGIVAVWIASLTYLILKD